MTEPLANDASGSLSNIVEDAQKAATKELGKKLASNVLDAGAAKARTLVSSYGSVQSLRPYFDVEPADVRRQLVGSFRPRFSKTQLVPGDMYGPTMLAFTLSAVLLVTMKSTGATVRAEGTLMGTAFGLTFSYWFGSSAILLSIGYIFNCTISTIEMISAIGYGLLSFSIALLSGHIRDHESDFYMAWIIVGGLASLKVAGLLYSRTADHKQGLILGVFSMALHMLYLFYLHKFYSVHPV